ncbi:DUF423 domain-containing protein [Ferruginibacter sp.]
MNKNFLFTATILGALAVALGAFGAHSLKTMLSQESLQVFETAVRYQFYHVFALLAAGVLYKEYPGKLLQWSGNLFIIGIIFFSGSLYALCALQDLRWLGAITPLGGLCFIAGWILMAISVARR